MSEQQIIIVERPRVGIGALIFLGLLLFLFAPRLFFRLLWILLRLLVRMLLGR